MVNIVIYDDSPQMAATLHEKLERLLPTGCEHSITVFGTIDELVAALAQGMRIDLLFADVIMAEGELSGIEVVERLFPPGSDTQVIYVSGYLEQALEVYSTKHLYFLLKPVDEAKLSEALDLALTAIDRKRPAMMRVKVGHKEQLINTASIMYLSSNLRKVTVHCKDSEVETYAKLDDVAPQLPGSFVRCHRSFIANLAFAVSLEKDALLLSDRTRIPVSRRRAKEVQHALLARILNRSTQR